MKTTKFFTKAVAMLLACVLVLGLAACGNDNKETTKAPADKTTVADEKTDGEIAGGEQTTEAPEVDITYPLDTEEKLTYWASGMGLSSAYTSWEQSPFHSGIADKTGIDVEWIYPPAGSNVNQAYQLMMTEEVLPDMVHVTLTSSDGLELLEEEVIWDLTEYLPLYAPDYWEFINRPENQAELYAVTTEDGRHYRIPAFPESWYNVTYMGPVIRQDWLDECGLEMPVTIADWENVLVKFKEKYGARLGFTKSNFNSVGIASGFGAHAGLTAQFYLDGDTVKLAQLQPEYKEMMETLIRWWNMDLIDKDSLTLDNNGVRTKALNNEIGVTMGAMSLLTNLVKDAAKEGSSANWVGMEYARTAAGEPTTRIQIRAARTSDLGTFITKSCSEEKLAVALAWLNYGWTEAGKMYWNFGEEGESYTVDAEGNVAYTDLVLNDEAGLTDAIKKYSATATSAPVIQMEALVKLKNSKQAADAVNLWIKNTVASEYRLPSLIRTVGESDIYSTKYTPIETYINQEVVKFFVGDRDFSEYDAFVAKIKEMGIEDVLAVQQAAYNRYNARASK